MAKQTEDDPSHQQVLAAIFGQTRLDKYICMPSEGKLTIHATPWAKQFQDHINSLEEFDEGDDFVPEMNGDLRKVFFMHMEDFSILILPCCEQGTGAEQSRPRERNAQNIPAQMPNKRRREVHVFLHTQSKSGARSACFVFLVARTD